jgi:hypothetical protein
MAFHIDRQPIGLRCMQRLQQHEVPAAYPQFGSDNPLRVLQTGRDIAGVLINPAQVLQPNTNVAPDSAPVSKAETGSAHIDRGAYAD